MLASTDLVGLGALISAIAAAVVSIIVALQQKPIAAKVEEVRSQVATGNGGTLGDIVEGNDLRYLNPKDPPPKPDEPPAHVAT